MLLLENIFLAINGLKSNKTRAALTMLGIIIGIAAVISIMTIGNSLSAEIMNSMSSNGASVITAYVSQKDNNDDDLFFGGMSFMSDRQTMRDKDYINESMMDEIREHFGSRVAGIALSERVGDGTAKNGDLYAYVTVVGDNSDQFDADVEKMIAGRKFLESDQQVGRKVAVVSDYYVNNMFGGDAEAAIGKEASVVIGGRYYTYTIVGVYEYSDDGFGFSFSDASEKDTRTDMYLPFAAAQNQTHNNKGLYKQIGIVASDVSDTSALSEDIASYMNDYFYRSNNNYKISTSSMQTLLDSLEKELATVTLGISFIAGIALLVGGIGVMNIMLVSITERTREIGTRKALGATNASIRIQFIVEAIVLCLVGGFIGIILGIIIGSVASAAMECPAAPSIKSIIISVSFSAFIGIFFGYYPANKAAKMNPIDALRYE